MIQPGLTRISQLLKYTTLPWRAVHVAGTNGKGSVCAYVSAMLHAANIKTGRFTSPHLIDRWDCITINENVVDESKFHQTENAVRKRNADGNIKASEFEVLTATAFELFTQEKVDVGVVEVGLGGQQDATNIIEHPLVTVITKVGKDHQQFLGDTIEEIATQKAGIMKKGAPCIVDATNPASVLKVFEKTAQEIGVGLLVQVPISTVTESANLQSIAVEQDLEHHQKINLSLAYLASKLVLQGRAQTPPPSALIDGARRTFWPGRLQSLSITALTGRQAPVLLDGAHNAQSIEVLGAFVDKKIRTRPHPVTWVIGISAGKDLRELLSIICQPGDNVVAVEFGMVDGMPWVSPAKCCAIMEAARDVGISGSLHSAERDVVGAVKLATNLAGVNPIVICGSLYLVSDVLRLLRDMESSTAEM